VKASPILDDNGWFLLELEDREYFTYNSRSPYNPLNEVDKNGYEFVFVADIPAHTLNANYLSLTVLSENSTLTGVYQKNIYSLLGTECICSIALDYNEEDNLIYLWCVASYYIDYPTSTTNDRHSKIFVLTFDLDSLTFGDIVHNSSWDRDESLNFISWGTKFTYEGVSSLYCHFSSPINGLHYYSLDVVFIGDNVKIDDNDLTSLDWFGGSMFELEFKRVLNVFDSEKNRLYNFLFTTNGIYYWDFIVDYGFVTSTKYESYNENYDIFFVNSQNFRINPLPANVYLTPYYFFVRNDSFVDTTRFYLTANYFVDEIYNSTKTVELTIIRRNSNILDEDGILFVDLYSLPSINYKAVWTHEHIIWLENNVYYAYNEQFQNVTLKTPIALINDYYPHVIDGFSSGKVFCAYGIPYLSLYYRIYINDINQIFFSTPSPTPEVPTSTPNTNENYLLLFNIFPFIIICIPALILGYYYKAMGVLVGFLIGSIVCLGIGLIPSWVFILLLVGIASGFFVFKKYQI